MSGKTLLPVPLVSQNIGRHIKKRISSRSSTRAKVVTFTFLLAQAVIWFTANANAQAHFSWYVQDNGLQHPTDSVRFPNAVGVRIPRNRILYAWVVVKANDPAGPDVALDKVRIEFDAGVVYGPKPYVLGWDYTTIFQLFQPRYWYGPADSVWISYPINYDPTTSYGQRDIGLVRISTWVPPGVYYMRFVPIGETPYGGSYIKLNGQMHEGVHDVLEIIVE